MTLLFIGRPGYSNLIWHNLLQSLINAYSMYLCEGSDSIGPFRGITDICCSRVCNPDLTHFRHWWMYIIVYQASAYIKLNRAEAVI